jgi:hypothetical protein
MRLPLYADADAAPTQSCAARSYQNLGKCSRQLCESNSPTKIVELLTIMHYARHKVLLAYRLPSLQLFVSYCVHESTRTVRASEWLSPSSHHVLQAVNEVQACADLDDEGQAALGDRSIRQELGC